MDAVVDQPLGELPRRGVELFAGQERLVLAELVVHRRQHRRELVLQVVHPRVVLVEEEVLEAEALLENQRESGDVSHESNKRHD